MRKRSGLAVKALPAVKRSGISGGSEGKAINKATRELRMAVNEPAKIKARGRECRRLENLISLGSINDILFLPHLRSGPELKTLS